MIRNVYIKYRYILSIIFIILILLNTILLNNTNSITTRGDVNIDNNEYIVENVWKTVLNERYRKVFSNGDFNRDGFEEVIFVSNNTLYVLNGFNGSIYRNISFTRNIVGFKPIDDLDHDGFNEVVVITGSFTATSMSREFIVWNLAKNRIMRRNNITIEIGYYDLTFDYSRLITYRNNVVEYVFPHAIFTGVGFKLVSYIIQYNVLDSDIRYSVVENKGYLIYSDRLDGDIDNDGICEYTNRYIIEHFFEGTTPKSLKYVFVIRDREGRILFSNITTSPLIRVKYSNSSLNNNYFLLEKYENISTLNKTAYRIIAVKENTGITYIKDYLESDGEIFPIGDVSIVIYFNETSNETILELLNTNSGVVIGKTSLGVMSIEEFVKTMYSINGLGDVDNDGVKEFFMENKNECLVVKTNYNLTTYRLTNCSIDNIVLSYKTIKGVYLLKTRVSNESTELEVFTIKKPGISPLIGTIPMPYEPLPVRTRGVGLESIIIVFLATIIVVTGFYITIKYIKQVRKR